MSTLDVRVRIEGLDRLRQELSPARVEAALERVVEDVASIAQSRMAAYPPEGDYNKSGPYPKRWYQRTVGPRWALA